MRKIIGIASSDYHLHNFPDFNEGSSRFGWALTAMQYIANQALINNVPSLFTGDLFHNPKDVDNDIVGRTMQAYEDMYERNKIPFVAIDGNHDQKEKNTLTNRSPQYLKAFQHFKTMHSAPQGTSYILYHDTNMEVWGLPYYTYEKDWVTAIKQLSKVVRSRKSKKILLLHGNAPNAKTTTGQTIEDCMLPQDLDNFFKDWDLVLFGHIHRPQKLSKKCYMLGSHIQQNRGDEGCEMGYWEIYSDMTMKFKSLNKKFPTFITIKDGADKNNNIQKAKATDYLIYSDAGGPLDETTEQGDSGTRKAFRNLTDRKALSKAYCRTKGITDKGKRHALTQILNQV